MPPKKSALNVKDAGKHDQNCKEAPKTITTHKSLLRTPITQYRLPEKCQYMKIYPCMNINYYA